MPAISQAKRLKRALLNNRVSQGVLAALIAVVIYAIFLSSRKQRAIHPLAAPYIDGKKNAIFAFWHGRMMLLPAFCPPGRPMYIISSRHRDGLLMSRVTHRFGQETIFGSSSQGGAAAFKGSLRALKGGGNISITPDGPRGPYQTVSEGILALARLSGLPILPISFSATRRFHARSWDRFCFARPFGKIIFVAGEPFTVPRDATPETLAERRTALENVMRKQVDEADALAGGVA